MKDRQQSTNQGISENTSQGKHQKFYSQVYYIQSAENQRQRANLERSQKGETTYPQRYKNYNYTGLLYRNNVNQEETRVKY